MFLLHFWYNVLYLPLLNILFWIYHYLAFENMGLAVMILTIFSRILFLPLSIIDEKRKAKMAELSNQIALLKKNFSKDQVLLKLHIRKLLKQNKLTPWASVLLLGLQALILVLLYQVMTKGIKYGMSELYGWVPKPQGQIDTTFLGLFDTAQRNVGLSLLVAVLLFFRIVQEQIPKINLLNANDKVYRYAFPLFTFIILAILPSVKIVFILTSMFLSWCITMFRQTFFPVKKFKPRKIISDDLEKGLPSVRDRFNG